MKKKKLEKIIYSINVEDVQTVALEQLERELNEQELKIVEDEIGEHIPWYDAIGEIIAAKIEAA